MAVDAFPPWEERAKDKQSRILSGVPAQFIHDDLTFSETETASVQDVPDKLLSPLEKEITSLKAEELIPALASKTYTAVQVLDSFTHRAAIAHKLLHCCLEFCYSAARARATQLDQYLAETGKMIGPLHGLPISVKDQCRMVGTETTCGFICNLGTKDTEDCILVDILQQAGAVPFVKTNLSVGCMWGETVNHIIGRTSNAYNRSFSCGGSSGGEGALLSFRGSPMGIGTDLGGSIRSPCAYNGLFGLRPSNGRIPYYRMLNSCEGQEIIPSVVGPMTHSAKSLELITKTVVDSQPWLKDPQCLPIPWREEEANGIKNGRKLRIGIMHWDNVILPQPPIRKALKDVEEKLKAAGHEIVEWKIDHVRALDMALRTFAADANGDIERTIALAQEPGLDQIGKTTRLPLTLLESWALAVERTDFQAEILRQWNATASVPDQQRPVDAYISPVNPSICPQHGDYGRIRYLAYTSTVNLLDYAACTIPWTFVDEKNDLPDDPSGVRDAAGDEIPGPTCDLDRKIRANFDPMVFKGLPVSFQVVARKLEEEKVLAILGVLERLKG